MNGPRFSELFLWESRQVARSPLFWTVSLLLAACFIWGALNGAALHRTQAAAQASARAAQTAHETELDQRAAVAAEPLSADAPPVNYWQDPTNLTSFVHYLAVSHVQKPHLPASTLAVGVSDLAPSRLDVKPNALFGYNDDYDFEGPRGLAMGRFDLSFAILYLLPIALILLFGLLGTVERDRGMLRLVAAQSVAPNRWLGVRVAAILAWIAPVAIVSMLAALAISSLSFSAAWRELAAALALVLAWMLFWSGIAMLVLSRLPGAAGALGAFTAIWAMLLIGVPAFAAAASAIIAPPPSAVAYIDATRRIEREVDAERDRIVANAFAANPMLRSAPELAGAMDGRARRTLLTPETERRLAPLREARETHADQQARLAAGIGYLAPPLGLQGNLARLAGTDPERQRRFEEQVRQHHLRLRETLYPLVWQEIVSPAAAAEPATRGKRNFTDRSILPPFAMRDESATARALASAPFTLWLLALAAILACLGLRRLSAWPRDL